MQCYCEKCGRTMDETQFYTSNNLEKYPNAGKLKQCKKCITLHVDNWEPDTFKHILQEVDVPYIKDEWDRLLANYQDRPEQLTGLTIIGRYLAKMKLKQFKDYRWADTERLEEEAKQKKTELMRAAGYSGEEIEIELAKDHAIEKPAGLMTNATDLVVDESLLQDDLMDELSDEDKTYLRLKWGRGYRADEWVRMEQLYEDMMASYDIQGAGAKDTLIMICKASLKANQCIDSGDIEGFQKMSKTYDALMKSSKLTAAQNKNESGSVVDSIGELVAMCEREGMIPRYYIDTPNDKVDRTLQDLQNYTRTLVTEEMNLGNLIEQSLARIERDKMNEANVDADDGVEDEEDLDAKLFADDAGNYIQDEDYSALKDLEEQLEAEDAQYLQSIKGADD